jgi:hypothetical protein
MKAKLRMIKAARPAEAMGTGYSMASDLPTSAGRGKQGGKQFMNL